MHRSSLLTLVKASFASPIALHTAIELCNGNSSEQMELSRLPPLIQEKDTELQAVSIPDILFPAPKLPFHFFKKKWKPENLNQQDSCMPASQEFAMGQFTKSHHETISLLQSPKETTSISARALADKSKHSPAHNTCFLITARGNKWFLMKVKELGPWVTVHLQLHPFPPKKSLASPCRWPKNLLILWNLLSLQGSRHLALPAAETTYKWASTKRFTALV